MRPGPGLYVEADIATELVALWERTQQPELHVRWDARFTRITPTGEDAAGHQTFTYALHLPSPRLPWRIVAGKGTSVGERHRPDGSCTSALRFASPDGLSLLETGSGYWRYAPHPEGVRFWTGYDYTPRWGAAGVLIDRVAFRPVMGWLTAWSFDRLRIWLETGVSPERSSGRWLMDLTARVGAVAAAALATRASSAPMRCAAAVAVLAAAVVLPAPDTVPRARRCLRSPRHAGTDRAPSTLKGLAAP